MTKRAANNSVIETSREGSYARDFAAFDALPLRFQRLLQYGPHGPYSSEDALNQVLTYGEEAAYRSVVTNFLRHDPNFWKNVKHDIPRERPAPNRRQRRRGYY